MYISSELVSEFVKATKDTSGTVTESTVYGTIKKQNDVTYVQLDGSELLTPVVSTVNAKDGDRVTVLIKNHSATITGNITSPSASSDDVQDMSDVANKITELEIAVAKKVSTDELDVESARIDALVAENVTIKDSISASEADISKLQASYLTVEETLSANKASIESLEADIAKIDAVSAEDLEAINADIYSLQTTYATFETATTKELTAISATIDSLDTSYASIDLANVAVADIGTVFANVGLITSATIKDGHITGYLDAVEVNAASITAGTLSVERLIFRGSTNSIVYELNNITGALQSVQSDTLNGEILTDRSITVDKIVANSITANEIAAGAITASELATNAVTADKILAGAVSADKIASSAITTDKLAANAVTAAKISTGAITTDKLAASAVTAAKIAAGTITADKIDVDDLFAQDITATGTITGATINGGHITSTSDSGRLHMANGYLFSYDANDIPAISFGQRELEFYSAENEDYVVGRITTVYDEYDSLVLDVGSVQLLMSSDWARLQISYADDVKMGFYFEDDEIDIDANYIRMYGTLNVSEKIYADYVSAGNLNWKTCTVTANSAAGSFYNNSQSAKYRYDNNVLEICVRGTFVAKTTIAKGTTLMTVSGLDIAIPISQAVIMWDETSQAWRRVLMDTAGAITLASNTSISSGAWLSGTTLDFKIFRT